MYKNKKILAIIPARKGSKRFPGKNLKKLNGKSLTNLAIECALNSKYIDTILLSTDDKEVIRNAEKYKINAPFIRPKELSDDSSTTIDVIYHAIEYYSKNNKSFDYVLLLQPTSPLRKTEDIDKAIESMTWAKSIISVCKAEHSPLWSNVLPNDLSMKSFIPSKIKNMRSQDLPVYYRLNGAVFISEIKYLYRNNGFFGEYTKAYIMPQNRSIDIDTNIDFELCKLLLNEDN